MSKETSEKASPLALRTESTGTASGFSAGRACLGEIERRLQPLAGHELDRACLWQRRDRAFADLAPIAHDDHLVGDLIDLAEAMADEHDGGAAIAQAPHDVEQAVGFLARQAGIGLVEEEDMRIGGERAGDLDQLPLGGGKAGTTSAEVGEVVLEAEAREQRLRLADQRAAAVQRTARPAAEPGEEDVLRHRHLRDELRFLMHDSDTHRLGGERAGEADGRTRDEDLAAIGLVDAGADADHRRLAGAVLPQQRRHHAAAKAHADIGEGMDRAEALVDRNDFEGDGLFGGHGFDPVDA